MIFVEMYAVFFCAGCVTVGLGYYLYQAIRWIFYRYKFAAVFKKDVPNNRSKYIQRIEFGGDKHTFILLEKDGSSSGKYFNVKLGRNGVSTHCWKRRKFLDAVRVFNELEKKFYIVEPDAYEYVLKTNYPT